MGHLQGTTAATVLRTILIAAAAPVSILLAPPSAEAQYFGRNKVMYDDFSFRVMETEHFDVYFYRPDDRQPIEDFGRMSERWYERLARVLQHEFAVRKPLIAYRNGPDFQQTNAIPGFISQATGGVTESVKNRVILPFAGSYPETDHVLGHELVHAFQYDLAQAGRGGGATTIGRAPLWFIEGMAEYLSLGREDAHTAMWMRDAVARDSMPTLDDLSNPQEYFPYRFGHAWWAYVAGGWGDDIVGDVYRAVGRRGVRGAVEQVLGVDPDTLSAAWAADTRSYYAPALEDRTPPTEVGEQLLGPSGEGGGLNLAPEVSPDGEFVVLVSQQDPFSVDLFIADAETGEIVDQLASSSRNPHFDALAFTNTSGSWSPDGQSFAFVVYREGDNDIAIADVDERSIERTYSLPDMGAVYGLAWSPDGGRIAFSGSVDGVNDLYLLDVETGEVEALTSDRYMERQPAWSPDGTTLVFATDRGAEASLDLLTFPKPGLGFLDVAAREIEVRRPFEGAKHIDPEYSPDGRSVYLVSDRDGFSDIYRYVPDTGETFQITNLTTGVSGLTALAPAMSVAEQSGDLVFTAFHSGDYIVARIAGEEAAAGTPVQRPATRAAALLPPPEPQGLVIVSDYLEDPNTGLPPLTPTWEVRDYDADLQLDYIAQPTAGVTVDRLGTALGGSVAAFFSDMLGNHQLGVGIQANGGVRDIGGQVLYMNRSGRLNWGLQGGRIPYRNASTRVGTAELEGDTVRAVDLFIRRTTIYRAAATIEYPLSTTQRLEFQVGGTRMSFDREIRRDFISDVGRVIERREIDAESPSAINLASASGAFVRDNSQFGFTSPVAGQRARFEVEGNIGTLEFVNALVDFRRYLFVAPLTVGFRTMHYGRYGPDANSDRITPLFLGQQTFVRGYSFGSFNGDECTTVAGSADACPEFDRLVGTRIGLVNLELRVPLLGTNRFGLIDFPYLPTELALFADAGVAWTSEEAPELELTRRSEERIPVTSAGASLRFNVLGRLIMEVFYAVPFQRPGKDHVWGFQISPGW